MYPPRLLLLASLATSACGVPIVLGAGPSSPRAVRANQVTEPYVDIEESVEPIVLVPLFDASAPAPSFPNGAVADRDCLARAAITGDRAKDYDTIAAACGAPTGLRPYVKPVTGKLHYVHDQRDAYSVRLLGGYCYRVFAVSDASIANLDVRVNASDGSRSVEDTSNSSVALIESDAPWCVAVDSDYRIELETEGTGVGSYTFGVWARPKR